VIKFSGAINLQTTPTTQSKDDESGKSALPTAVGVIFSPYELQEGGSPLWSESQKVPLDEQGHYTVLLGATQPDGLPLDLFTSGKALWPGAEGSTRRPSAAPSGAGPQRNSYPRAYALGYSLPALRAFDELSVELRVSPPSSVAKCHTFAILRCWGLLLPS